MAAAALGTSLLLVAAAVAALIVADTGGEAAAAGGFAPGYCLPQIPPRQSHTSALDEMLSFCCWN